MRAVGIVAEYNPFHSGHAYQIARARELTGADAVVCAMSGSFVQRGAPAVADKWVRAKMALVGGADLVVELPCCYALSPAQDFARGAVSLLDAMGCVDFICFGSESGDLQRLSTAAHLLCREPEELSGRIKSHLGRGAGYPAAVSAALGEVGTWLGGPAGPNDILAVEYLRAMAQTKSNLRPVCVKRVGAGYHDTAARGSFASATALRRMLREGRDIAPYLPARSFEVWQRAVEEGRAPVWEERFDTAVLAALRRMDADALARVRGVGEGLERRIARAAMRAGSIEALTALASTKRYTKARIARIVWAAMLGIFQPLTTPNYLRVLGATRRGTALLAEMKEVTQTPVLTKIAGLNREEYELLEVDLRATDLYSLGYPKAEKRIGRLDFLTSPTIVDGT